MIVSAYLSEDIVVASINGVDMNLLEAMKTIIAAAVVVYSGKDLAKLANLFKVECVIDKKDENSDSH